MKRTVWALITMSLNDQTVSSVAVSVHTKIEDIYCTLAGTDAPRYLVDMLIDTLRTQPKAFGTYDFMYYRIERKEIEL